MEIIIKTTAEEIAALVLAAQERQCAEIRERITQEIQDRTEPNRFFR